MSEAKRSELAGSQGSALLDRLEAEIARIKDHAAGATSMTEPEGYAELSDEARAVADRCLNDGLDAFETALRNWIADHRPCRVVPDDDHTQAGD